MNEPVFAFAASLVVAVGTFAATVWFAARGTDGLAIAALGVAGAAALARMLMAHAEMIRREEGVLRR